MEESFKRQCQDMHDRAIFMTGLCEVLCEQSANTIAEGDFSRATVLSFAYEALADCAARFANDIAELAP